jgi:hypothetical protein
VEVDFDNKIMTMQVPYQDSLLKPQNTKYLRRLIRLGMIITYVPVVAHFSIVLSSPFRNCSTNAGLEKLKLMDEIGDQLGFQHGQIMNIAKSIYRVWERWVNGVEPRGVESAMQGHISSDSASDTPVVSDVEVE